MAAADPVESLRSWKGPSRVLKTCHWCTKEQKSGEKPFQYCSQCKEVIYFSKECQRASWPHHKSFCKISSEARKNAEKHPGMVQAVNDFKTWHSTHAALLRYAGICALDLGNKPSNIDNNVVFLELKLKANHAELPVTSRYEPKGGFTLTLDEAREMLATSTSGISGLLDGIKSANEHMQKKGGLGVATYLLKMGDICDLVKMVMPSLATAKQVQENDNWGENWVARLAVELELGSK